MIGDHTPIRTVPIYINTGERDIQGEIKQSMLVELLLEPAFFILLIAKIMITVLWRNVKPPTVHQWKKMLKDVYLMESTTAKLQLKTLKKRGFQY